MCFIVVNVFILSCHSASMALTKKKKLSIYGDESVFCDCGCVYFELLLDIYGNECRRGLFMPLC